MSPTICATIVNSALYYKIKILKTMKDYYWEEYQSESRIMFTNGMKESATYWPEYRVKKI